MTVCHVCRPPVPVITASLNRRDTVLLDATPHPAGLYTLSTVNGWVRATKITHDQPAPNRHRTHTHRTPA